MSNIAIFRNYLKKINVRMEELPDINGGIFFRGRQRLKNGGDVTLTVAFDTQEEVIDLNIYEITTINNPLKKEAMHSLLNELNSQYRYSKFYEIEGRIEAHYPYSINQGELDPEIVFRILILLYQTTDEVYHKIMKLQWS